MASRCSYPNIREYQGGAGIQGGAGRAGNLGGATSHSGSLVETRQTDNSESDLTAEFKPTDCSQLDALTGTGLAEGSVIEAG